MEDKKYIEQLKDIRVMMDKSSRFVSLSGLSGVLAGLYALSGAFIARYIINHSTIIYASFADKRFQLLLLNAVVVMALSMISAIVLSSRKARKQGERVWNSTTRRLMFNFCIPMITGGLLSISLIQQGHVVFLAPITLIFYGLALVNASKYTYETLRYLGISFLILGLVNTQFLGYGLPFWTIGFGGFHIVYGTLMYFQLERKSK